MKVYFDMDGTLAKWEWVGPDTYTAKGYFATRPMITSMVEAAKLLAKKGIEVFILSKVLQDDHSLDDKNTWIDRVAGGSDVFPKDRRIFVPYGEAKSKYVTPDKNDILVDDYNPNLEDWNGIAIKCLNGINGGSNQWNGYTVDVRSTSKHIAKTIEGIYLSSIG